MAKKDKKVKSKTKAKGIKSSIKLKSLVYKDNRLNKKLGCVGKKYKVGKKSKYSVSKLKNTKSKVVKAKTSKKRSSSSKKTSVGANRYRSLISAISKWNKKQFEDTGMKLSRDEMYARYRMIRDEFPDVSTKELVSDLGLWYKKEKKNILKAVWINIITNNLGLLIGPMIAKKIPPPTERERNRDKFFKKEGFYTAMETLNNQTIKQ